MATYYVSAATGNDGDDGLSEGNAWVTIDKAMNTVGAGDKVWVKADGTYTENPIIDTVGTNTSAIVFEGYTSTIGDGGQVAITGKITDSLGVVGCFYCFKNFNIDGSDYAIETSVSHITYRNCVFRDTTNAAFSTTGRSTIFYECEFLDAGGDGFRGTDINGMDVFINCKFYRISETDIDTNASAVCFNCIFFSCGTYAIDAGQGSADCVVVALNCTIDGDAKDTTIGIRQDNLNPGTLIVVNNIVYDCATGVDCNHGDRDILVYNLVNACTTPYAQSASDQEGGVSSAPDFVNEVGGADYSLNEGSPAIGAGTDAGS